MTKRLEGPHLLAVEGHIVEFGRYDVRWGLVCAAPEPPAWELPDAGDREGGFFYQPVIPRGDDGPWEREYTVTVSVCRCDCGGTEEVRYRRHLWQTPDGRRWESTEILPGSLTSAFGLDVSWAHETNATGDLGEAAEISRLLKHD